MSPGDGRQREEPKYGGGRGLTVVKVDKAVEVPHAGLDVCVELLPFHGDEQPVQSSHVGDLVFWRVVSSTQSSFLASALVG